MRELSRGIRLLQPVDYRRMPWKNGRGWTTEIAVFPADAGLTGKPFDWRVSLAEVETDGEFSAFPGYDRTIMLTEGAGMELSFDSAPVKRIERRHQLFSFKGEWKTRCRLLNGPVRDFNVMSARAKFTHTCEVITSPVSIDWQPHKETVLVYCFEGGLVLEGVSDGQIELGTRHGLLLEKRGKSPKILALKISGSSTGMIAAIVMCISI
ncbi:MAG: HutD/Ves family protein [Gammaproteobacteria bacterium]